jgi:hypothetical protein
MKIFAKHIPLLRQGACLLRTSPENDFEEIVHHPYRIDQHGIAPLYRYFAYDPQLGTLSAFSTPWDNEYDTICMEWFDDDSPLNLADTRTNRVMSLYCWECFPTYFPREKLENDS